MRDRVLTRGATYQWNVSWVDGDGNAIDFTLGTRVGYLRLKKLGVDGVALSINTGQSDYWAWTSQAGGTGYWKWLSSLGASLDGLYLAEAYWKDTADDPDTIHPCGQARYRIVAPPIAAY